MLLNIVHFKEDAARVHCMTSFFYTKLSTVIEEAWKGRNSVHDAIDTMHKWSKGVNILSKDYVFVPINDG